MYPEELTAPVFQIRYHHTPKLVFWLNHFIVDIHKVTRCAKKVNGPLKYGLSVVRPHVDQEALGENKCW